MKKLQKKCSGSRFLMGEYHITTETVKKACQCLIDNGIDADEAETVLQALGYILLDEDFEFLYEDN